MSTKVRNITALALLSATILIYRLALLELSFGWSSSTAQFVLLPFVFAALTLFSFWQQRFPRYAIALAVLACSLLGIASSGLKIKEKESLKVFLSPFLGDANESQTIKFSDLISRNLQSFEMDLTPEGISNPLTTPAQAQEFLKKRREEQHNSAALVISGSPRWLSLSVSPGLGSSLVSKPLLEVTSALGISLSTEVSGTGVSDGFSEASRNFIAHLIAALADLSNENLINAEDNLSDAASIAGKWTSTAHRAYALWLLGTLYLNKAFTGDSVEPAYLLCSIDYLTRARAFLRNDDTPELLAAIINNRGIAHFLSYVFLGKKDLRKQALREFRAASRLAFKKSSIMETPPWLVARINNYYFNKPKNLKRLFEKRGRKNRSLISRQLPKKQLVVGSSSVGVGR